MTSKFSIDNRELLQRISSGEAVVGIDFGNLIVGELAAFRLSAMDSEPVAYTDERNLGYIDRGRETAYLWGKQNSESSDVALYRHAQPAPAVPGKWIPVSERMPENDGAYLCWDNRYVTTYAFIFGAWQANQFIAKNITHWMPLPAGPQGVKGE